MRSLILGVLIFLGGATAGLAVWDVLTASDPVIMYDGPSPMPTPKP